MPRIMNDQRKKASQVKKIAICFLVFTVLFTTIAPISALADGADTAAMTIVPYGPVSNKIEAEVRVSVYNASADGDYTVKLILRKRGFKQEIGTVTKHVDVNTNKLFSFSIDTSSLSGTYYVKAIVKKSGKMVKHLREHMEVIETAATERSVPIVTTAFLDPGAYVDGVYSSQRDATEQDVRDKVDALCDAGVETIILSYAEYVLNGWGAFYPSQIPELTDQVTLVGNSTPTTLEAPVDFDFIKTVLDQALINDQKVMIGIGRGTDAWITFDTRTWLRPEEQSALNAQYLQQHVDFAIEVTDELYDLYKDYDSFYGWYLSHECQDINWANAFYNPVADHMHAISPEKPVLVSPSAITPWLIVDQMRSALSSSSADIFAYQDSVGAGYDETTFTYTYNPQVRIGQMDAMYNKYKTEHENSTQHKHFWANIECWEMAGPTYTNSYAADFPRFKQQIDIVKKYVDSISTYEAGGFLESPTSTLVLGGQSAVDLYVGYKTYYDNYLQ